jgi:type II secretory pathway pseudopilin PulG
VKQKTKIHSNSGFSILEVVSAIFIFSVTTLAIYGSFSAGLKSLAQSKHRIAATELANEKMEIVRNMQYDDIGTVGGVPDGALLQNETVQRSNQKFNVHTFIRYWDDADDGLAEADENEVITDYKEVKIEVTWAGVAEGYGAKAFSKFVPNGVETDVGGGTLRFNAMDGSGAPVSGADVRIRNTDVEPDIDIDTITDSNGSVLLSGMPPGDRNYEISVSKGGYESIVTSAPYPTTPYNPTDEHSSVIEGSLNTKAIILDKLADIHIYSKGIDDQALPNMDFSLTGGRIIGTDPGGGPDVTNYQENLSTGETGDVNVTDVPPGKYNVSLNEPGYTMIGSDATFPLAIVPDQSATVNLIIASDTENSLIVSVKDSISGLPVSGAAVRVSNGVDFDVTLTTGAMGQVYFPPTTDPETILASGDYTIETTADNYENYSGSVNVNQLVERQIDLVPVSGP